MTLFLEAARQMDTPPCLSLSEDGCRATADSIWCLCQIAHRCGGPAVGPEHLSTGRKTEPPDYPHRTLKRAGMLSPGDADVRA